MKRIFQIIKTNQVLVKNFTSLSLLQFSNYLFPIITLPYLVRVLGPEKYGLVNFAAAFTGYFIILTDYGFNLSATQEISINREDKKKVSEIFSSVLTVKILLLLISTIIFLLLVFFVPLFKENLYLYIITFVGVLGSVLFPIWLFQGIEEMNFIFFINFSVRVIITICIFVFIQSESDFIKYAGLNSIAQLLIGIIGLVVIITKMKIGFSLTKLALIKEQFKSGWSLFLSSVSINLYTTSNVFILGLFAPANIVGYYSAADKVRMAFQGLLSPMSQSVFPYVNKLLKESYQKFIIFNKKLFNVALFLGIIISSTLFLFATPIVHIILGNDYQPSILVLRIIAWLPLIIFLSNVLGIQTMLPLNNQKSFAQILLLAAMINLVISFLIVPYYFEVGTSVSMLITEIFVTTSFYIFIKKNKIQII